MDNFSFVTGYKDNQELRNSFNQLAMDTFGIQFETWYKKGYWTEKYQPYSLTDNGKVVANVSANLIDLIVHGEIKKAVQIGTVMTHPNYRNKGLSRWLMEMVLNDFKDVDLIYLFANPSVLDFYPKFGFQIVEEVKFTQPFDYLPNINQGRVRKLNGTDQEDLQFIYSMVSGRLPNSRTFGTANTEELFMFYCMMVFSQDIYYFEEENALGIFQIQGDTLHVYDVVFKEEVDINRILVNLATKNVKQVVFHYHKEEKGINLHKHKHVSPDVLFIKNQSNVVLPEFKHPVTAQA